MTSSTVKMPANVYSSAFITLLITVPSSGSTCELKILGKKTKKKHAPAPLSPFSFHFLLPGAPAHETFLRKKTKKKHAPAPLSPFAFLSIHQTLFLIKISLSIYLYLSLSLYLFRAHLLIKEKKHTPAPSSPFAFLPLLPVALEL